MTGILLELDLRGKTTRLHRDDEIESLETDEPARGVGPAGRIDLADDKLERSR